MTLIPDTRADDRWPDYTPRAVDHGNLSSLSIPLAINEEEQVTGALNICARDADAFDEDSRSIATRFALYAAVAASNLSDYQSARRVADNLQIAVDSRAVIDQAKGILMERFEISADAAFQLLAQVSMTTNRKLRSVADHLVHTGEIPSS